MFFIDLPIEQFEGNKMKFVFQFDIDLDDYSTFLKQEPIVGMDQNYY